MLLGNGFVYLRGLLIKVLNHTILLFNWWQDSQNIPKIICVHSPSRRDYTRRMACELCKILWCSIQIMQKARILFVFQMVHTICRTDNTFEVRNTQATEPCKHYIDNEFIFVNILISNKGFASGLCVGFTYSVILRNRQ